MKAKEHLDTAWKLLANIPVSGDCVDIMFTIRQELRSAYKELKEEENGG